MHTPVRASRERIKQGVRSHTISLPVRDLPRNISARIVVVLERGQPRESETATKFTCGDRFTMDDRFASSLATRDYNERVSRAVQFLASEIGGDERAG